MSSLTAMLPNILTAGAAIAGSWFVSRASVGAEKVKATGVPYDTVSKRADDLETTVSDLSRRMILVEHDLTIVVIALDDYMTWEEGGANPPPPRVDPRALAIVKRHRLHSIDPVEVTANKE